MGYGDDYWGLYNRDYYRDPFPHSLLSTRQSRAPGIRGGNHKVQAVSVKPKHESCTQTFSPKPANPLTLNPRH